MGLGLNIGIDLGTATVLIYVHGKGVVLRELFPDTRHTCSRRLSPLSAGDAPDGLIHRSFRFLPTGVTEPRYLRSPSAATTTITRSGPPPAMTTRSTGRACPVQFDISKWYT